MKKENETRVYEICKVTLSIEKYYQDEVIFEIIDMDVCFLHIRARKILILLYGKPKKKICFGTTTR